MIWKQLLDELCTAIKEHDTLKLAVFLLKIINLQDMENFQPENTKIDFTSIDRSIAEATRGNGQYRLQSSGDAYFQQFFLLCMDLLVALKLNNVDTQIKCQIELINLLSKRLLDDPSFYLTPIIIVAKNLRLLVFSNYPPDNVQLLDSTSNPTVDNFTNSIQRPFKLLISNKSDNKINISAVHIFASHLFSIYFKYNKLNAAINLYKVLSNTILSSRNNLSEANQRIEMTPMLPTQSLFDYFIGLSLLIQSNYEKSFAFFNSAYQNKHSKSLNLKILFYLLPLNYLMSKKLPTNAFFKKYPDLQVIQPLYTSIKRLSLADYNKNLEAFKYLLLKFKVYSLYIKFQTMIQLETLKTAYAIYKETLSPEQLEKAHIVSFSFFTTSLNLANSDARNDFDTECLLCRLIATSSMKGYLSHAKQVVVLSKSSPFP